MRSLLLLAVLSGGCASTSDRIVAEALRTPLHEAFSVPSNGATMAPALARLEARLKAIGVTVTYADLSPDSLAGRTRGDRIEIEQTLAINGRLETLAHEAGHLFQSPTFSNAEGQAFAELVGAEVCARLGWNMDISSGRYLGAYKHGLAGALASKVDMERAVRVLLGEESP